MQDTTISQKLYGRNDIALAFGISAFYLLLSYLLIGFKPEQVVLVAIFNLLFFINSQTRQFIRGFSIFIIYWIIFDYMKAFPNYQFNTVHIESLYRMEKNLFGIYKNGRIMTPNEFFGLVHHPFSDFLSGLFYLTWIPVPLGFATYLFFKNRSVFYDFSLTFLLVNLLGFIVYYSYPAAPPWYIQLHGFDFIAGTKGNVAGLSRFDDMLGVPIFHSLYTKGSNVFAAMPSLHSSYPLIVFYYGLKAKVKPATAVMFFIIMTGIWFSAVYSSHHYVLDVLAGIICAITGIFIYTKITGTPFIQKIKGN